MKKKILTGMLVALGACGAEEASNQPETDEVQAMLDTVEANVARYQDVAAAEADGYMAMGECASSPEGAMGIHYMHMAKLQAPPKWDDPAGLLYLPTPDGLVLAGVEYFQPVMVEGAPYMGPETEPPPAEVAEQTPTLFEGHPFDGPMPGHEPGMPWHFDQHIWLFVENPDGLFKPWNPAASCE